MSYDHRNARLWWWLTIFSRNIASKRNPTSPSTIRKRLLTSLFVKVNQISVSPALPRASTQLAKSFICHSTHTIRFVRFTVYCTEYHKICNVCNYSAPYITFNLKYVLQNSQFNFAINCKIVKLTRQGAEELTEINRPISIRIKRPENMDCKLNRRKSIRIYIIILQIQIVDSRFTVAGSLLFSPTTPIPCAHLLPTYHHPFAPSMHTTHYLSILSLQIDKEATGMDKK